MIRRKVRRKQRWSNRRGLQRVALGRTAKGEYADQRVFQALRAMRHGASASRAAQDNRISLRTLKQKAGAALVQEHPGGRYRATKNDPLLRPLQVPGKHGPVEIDVSARTARKFAKYKADINRALAGDPKALAKWRGKKIAGVQLITDVKVLADQADKGLLPYALYRSFSGGRR
jgi:hypothetical protein